MSPGNSTTEAIYSYDSKGLLTGLKTTTGGPDPSVSTVTYSYLQDKLSRAYTVYQSATEQYSTDYSYNTLGQLTHYVWQGKYFSKGATTLTYKDSSALLYTDGKLTRITEYRQRDQYAYTVRYAVQTNAKGQLISTSTQDGNRTRFEYDADGELLRKETYFNEKLVAYTENEYDTQKTISSLTTPRPHPADCQTVWDRGAQRAEKHILF